MKKKIYLVVTFCLFKVLIFAQVDTVIYFNKGSQRCHGKMENGKKIGQWVCQDQKDTCCVMYKNYIDNDSLSIKEICKYPDNFSETYFYSCYEYSLDSIIYNGLMTFYSSKTGNYQEGYYSNNKKAGEWIYYKQLKGVKQISSIHNYKSDQLEGKTIIFKNGSISGIYMFHNGLADGLYVDFFFNNKLEDYGFKKNDAKIGLCYTFWDNGMIKSMGNHVGKYIYTDENGQYKYNDGSLANDEKSQSILKTYKSLPTFFSEYQLKTGTWKYWDSNGKLIREEYYEVDGAFIKAVDY